MVVVGGGGGDVGGGCVGAYQMMLVSDFPPLVKSNLANVPF